MGQRLSPNYVSTLTIGSRQQRVKLESGHAARQMRSNTPPVPCRQGESARNREGDDREHGEDNTGEDENNEGWRNEAGARGHTGLGDQGRAGKMPTPQR